MKTIFLQVVRNWDGNCVVYDLVETESLEGHYIATQCESVEDMIDVVKGKLREEEEGKIDENV